MNDPLADPVAAVAALDEPTRRRLYQHVVRQPAPVGRDEVAQALGISRATVAFHLDKLVDEQLLAVTFERRTGRRGPGAARPAKLYHRSDRQLAVSLPERHYELAGELLAASMEEADGSGEPPTAVLERRAYRYGHELGAGLRDRYGTDQDGVGPDGVGPEGLTRALDEQGFEPRTEDGDIVLGNCPFHRLARAHVRLVCGMNLHLLTGLVDGMGARAVQPRLAPAPGYCCVRLHPA